jgi:hypothetical protein
MIDGPRHIAWRWLSAGTSVTTGAPGNQRIKCTARLLLQHRGRGLRTWDWELIYDEPGVRNQEVD